MKIIITIIITIWVWFSLYAFVNTLDNHDYNWDYLTSLDKICRVYSLTLGIIVGFIGTFIIIYGILF